MKTLILTPRYSPGSVDLWREALRQGWDVERLTSWRVPPGFAPEQPVFYGEPLFARLVAGALGLVMIGPSADWLAGLPEAAVGRRIEAMSLDDARSLKRRCFVKPAAEKSFLAALYDSGASLPGEDEADGSVACLVSEPVEWRWEFRCFVRDRELWAMSPYLFEGELWGQEGDWSCPEAVDADARAFATELLGDSSVGFPGAFVLDVGLMRGSCGWRWSVVEANTAWGAGLYGCDRAAVLSVLERAVAKVGEEDRWDFFA